jgi:hypothetical protein
MLMSLSVVQFEAVGRLIPGWSAEADGFSTYAPLASRIDTAWRITVQIISEEKHYKYP